MRRLRQYNVEKGLMVLFHRSFVESAFTFCFVSWYGSLSLVNKNKLHKIINVSSKIAGVALRLESMAAMYETRLLPSGRRYIVRLLKARASRSFVPTSIGLLNKHLSPAHRDNVMCDASGIMTGSLFYALSMCCVMCLCIVFFVVFMCCDFSYPDGCLA